MAGKYIPPTYREGTEILQLPAVRQALAKAANRVAPRAKSIARGEGLSEFAAAITVQDGTRPKGRPYSYVLADTPDGERTEFGDTNTARRAILRRAAGTG